MLEKWRKLEKTQLEGVTMFIGSSQDLQFIWVGYEEGNDLWYNLYMFFVSISIWMWAIYNDLTGKSWTCSNVIVLSVF